MDTARKLATSDTVLRGLTATSHPINFTTGAGITVRNSIEASDKENIFT
jgi:hypothetical protein